DQYDECKLEVSADTSAIEVLARTEEGDILLAHCMLSEEDFDPTLPAPQFTVPLEGWRKIIFAVEPQTDGAAEQVSIKYQESTFMQMMRKIIFAVEPQTDGTAEQVFISYQAPTFMRTMRKSRLTVKRLTPRIWKWSLASASSCLIVFLGLITLQVVMFSYKIT